MNTDTYYEEKLLEHLNFIKRSITQYLKGNPVSRYFCDSLFWASEPKQAAKT